MSRVLIKLSGEALAGEKGFGINPETVVSISQEIKEVITAGNQVAIVVGGGNMWRGQTASDLGMDRSQADYIGMLATMMNGLALQDGLESLGVETRVQSSLRAEQVSESYIRRRAIRHMEKGRVVILVGGTGSPYFTTDSNSMLRGAELDCDMILMAKNGVDGVYDRDPNLDTQAVKYSRLTYKEILEKKLRVMDLTASSLADENNLVTLVFDMNQKGSILKAIKEDGKNGTKITT